MGVISTVSATCAPVGHGAAQWFCSSTRRVFCHLGAARQDFMGLPFWQVRTYALIRVHVGKFNGLLRAVHRYSCGVNGAKDERGNNVYSAGFSNASSLCMFGAP